MRISSIKTAFFLRLDPPLLFFNQKCFSNINLQQFIAGFTWSHNDQMKMEKKHTTLVCKKCVRAGFQPQALANWNSYATSASDGANC